MTDNQLQRQRRAYEAYHYGWPHTPHTLVPQTNYLTPPPHPK